MKTYFLHIVGLGDGCDYTISCNETVRMFQAEDMTAAQPEVRRILKDYVRIGVKKAVIVEVAEVQEFDIKSWNEELQEKKETGLKERQLHDKKKLYEELKREFGE